MGRKLSNFILWWKSKASSARNEHAAPGLIPPPPAPRDLLAHRREYTPRSRPNREADTPQAALYRIYENLVLDKHMELRGEVQAFWNHSSWLVCDIPDPQDPDPERYACLACIPALLVLAFNRRIDLGLPRDAPPIITNEQLDEWRTQELPRESEPEWAVEVPSLPTTLALPHWDEDGCDFLSLDCLEDERASPQCAKKNILIWQPHIHFA